jgi:hypothetical protein
VVFFLVHMVVRRLLRVMAGSSAVAALEVENAVLRHQLRVLRRIVRQPPLGRGDRLLLAAASWVLPGDRWPVFLVSPQTLLRWHRELVTDAVCAVLSSTDHGAAGWRALPRTRMVFACGQSRNLATEELLENVRFVLHDRDAMFSGPFDEILRGEGVRVIKTPEARGSPPAKICPREVLGGLIQEYHAAL